MMSRAVKWVLLLAAIGLWGAEVAPGRAEGGDPAALAAALEGTTATLQGGLKASENEGTAISAKFEIEDEKLQLSVYTMTRDGFVEVVADPTTGAAKAEKITDAEDLKAAASQKAAMAKATVPLLAATETAVKSNAGFRAVRVMPELIEAHATAEVTLLQGSTFKKVMERLD
jgi:hypothetical protein